ncbi:hypothetical protein PDY_37210 [Photobacterium damselae subsp. damselae]|uniref:beta strand repeat-containing protein n=1 Tax=Photobacterium damselae TaxID=38293 RepID=UPI002207D1E6|nr:hypothetical protein [Photobacterium damselae]BDR36673.1 hypothetical protein PDY_37210 [Photobacterium damselae subsp. damselae]
MNTHLKPISKWVAAGLITVGAGTLSSQALAATAAGTDIKNLATVTYEDSSGNSYQATSNEAVVTVAQIYSATIEQDINTTGSPGQTVYLPHVLTNTGNGSDTYTLTFAQNLPGTDTRGADTIDATTIKLFNDENNNGQPDAGEAEFTSGDTVTLNAGEQMNLIVAAAVPTTAVPGDTLGVTLEAEANNGTGSAVDGSVTDIGDNNDSADDTNASLITVTNDAVINTTKSATHLENIGTESSLGIDLDGDGGTDRQLSLIRYTVTVSNTGNTDAKDVVIFDGIPDGTVFVTGSTGATYDATSSGLLTVNGDTPIAYAANLVDESSHGVDLDQDGTNDLSEGQIDGGLDLNGNGVTTDTTVPGVYAVDDQLASNTTISMTFYVAYSPETMQGDTSIGNVAYVCSDLNGDGDYVDPGECDDPDPTTAGPDPSNPTTTTTTTTTGVGIIDTGTETGTSGGGDSDGTDNNVQTVDSAAAGSDVFFYNKIINNGNTVDSFDLTTVNTSFPAGTTFEYWNADGSAQLVDTNGNVTPDTGPVNPSTCTDAATTIDGITVNCNETLFRVVAKLPSDAANSTTPFDAVTTATSYNDATQSDTKTERLDNITGPTVDIANTPITTIDPAVDVDPVDTGDGFTSADVATVFNDEPLGSTVTAPIYIANEGGSSDSFLLGAEGSYNGASWETALPAGWTVVFKHNGIDTDADGTVDIPATGAVITATPTIPAGAVLWVTAEITIPSDPTQALADSDQASAIDANTDGDLDYIISLTVQSTASGAIDRKVEAFDVATSASIDITPTSLSNQIEPGGSVTYEHTLGNTGNTTETVDLSSGNNTTGFNNTISIDTDGDGTPDTEIGNLCDDPVTSPITVQQADGSTADVEVTCDATDGSDTVPSLTLEPGETIPMTVTVFAPTDATSGTNNITTITAVSTTDPTVTAEGQDNSEVITGQVRLYKYADLDTDCDGAADTDKNYLKQHTTTVEPGQCIVWKLIAVNEGTSDALNTVITDQLTEFTQFESGGSLVSCRNTTDAGTVVALADATYPLQSDDLGPLCLPDGTTGADVIGAVSGNTVTFTVGTLVPGDKAVGHFVVKVD